MNALKAGRVVSRQMLKLAMTPTQLSDGSAVPYGFGLSLKPDILGAHRVSHGGHWRAFKSDASWYPDTDLTIIQLTNNNEDDSVDHNSTALALIAAGETPAPLLESIIWKLPQKLENESALQLWFLDVLTQNPQRYRIEESDLNNLGYAYLKRKEVERAIKVFKLGTLAFPKSDNAFDSLADAYEAAGDLHGAYQSMQSAITLNPTSAVYTKRAEMLKAKLQ
jgi:tetratricopeptide (TPR) repeat protein